ncbi:DUF6356 family protein [Sphingomonas sp. 37zxx]|uniref:DUF6356 family protein n=1 Tax=Sphingomonas sp. 37zxx TaxID=1550073 RepID=UPI00053BF821|nr:DUF6356 family protein [Sphingomonas sp. 37zxx]
MFDRLFIDHPADVGETYFAHLRTASWFAGTMLLAGLACFVHALVPGLFVKTGSTAIGRLHDRMVVNRRSTARTPEPSQPTADA